MFSQILNINVEQGKLMVAVNSWKTGPKTMSCSVHDRLKFGKIFRKHCVQKCIKMDIENFITVAFNVVERVKLFFIVVFKIDTCIRRSGTQA